MSAPFVQPLLVGEVNPYGSDPAMALYPLPAHAAGGRLAAILNMSLSTYLRAFRRVNLCTGTWDEKIASAHARCILAGLTSDPRPLVLLGRKVARAFGLDAPPFHAAPLPIASTPMVILLPHPSGRCRAWNLEGSFERARALIYPLLPPRPEKS